MMFTTRARSGGMGCISISLARATQASAIDSCETTVFLQIGCKNILKEHPRDRQSVSCSYVLSCSYVFLDMTVKDPQLALES